uniref:N-tagged Nuclease n=1 Tax=Millerozyma acaciae TaxID=28986 RepID=UPI00051AABC8|nr:Chain A, N-tagged Nuclease [Millerozyma acaciae]4O88_B Chain B, N-tagged Nuclease [Millerozyma acaciae]
PTTCLNEGAIGYMAIDILQSQNIETITINDNEYKLNKFNNIKDYISKVWGAASVYNLDLGNDYTKWQSSLDNVETDNIKNYINGHDNVYYNPGGKNKYLIIEASKELKWKGNLNNNKFNVNLKSIFSNAENLKVGHSDLLKLFSSIVNSKGSDNQKKVLNSLLDNINDRRLKKLVSTGQWTEAISDSVANEIAKNNKLTSIKAQLGSQKTQNVMIDANGHDLLKIDYDKTFVTANDLKNKIIDKNKLENAKNYFKIQNNDKILEDIKSKFSKNINENIKGSIRDHAKLIEFTENKKFNTINDNSNSDSKIKSITCKVLEHHHHHH